MNYVVSLLTQLAVPLVPPASCQVHQSMGSHVTLVGVDGTGCWLCTFRTFFRSLGFDTSDKVVTSALTPPARCQLQPNKPAWKTYECVWSRSAKLVAHQEDCRFSYWDSGLPLSYVALSYISNSICRSISITHCPGKQSTPA